MLKKLLTSALFAGIAAGVVASVLHIVVLVPMITEAEQYETGALTHFTAAPDNVATSAQINAKINRGDDSSLWHRDTNALHRGTMTFGAEIITYTGFALLLVALFAMAEKYGIRIDARRGILWGLAGFLAFHVAPGAGLPPETPGIPAAELAARQIWWASTVVATASGIALIAFGRGWLVSLLGVGLILLPQIIGAPHLSELSGVVPPSLASLFAGRSIAVAAASWATLGLLCGYFWNKQAAS